MKEIRTKMLRNSILTTFLPQSSFEFYRVVQNETIDFKFNFEWFVWGTTQNVFLSEGSYQFQDLSQIYDLSLLNYSTESASCC